MRALPGRGFEHAGAQPLPAHLHQSERADAADLDARAIVLERLLHRLLDLSPVRTVIHVDEVDDHQHGPVALATVAGDLLRGLELGAGCVLLAIMTARTTPDGHGPRQTRTSVAW